MSMRPDSIRNVSWAVVRDGAEKRHVYRREVDLHLKDGRIVEITPAGAHPTGPGEAVLDGKGLLALPGLINIHSHPSTEPGYRGVREDHGVREHQMTGLFERLQAFRLDDAGRRAAATLAYSEMLSCGTTTAMDLTGPFDGWFDIMAASGMRCIVAAPCCPGKQWRGSSRRRPPPRLEGVRQFERYSTCHTARGGVRLAGPTPTAGPCDARSKGNGLLVAALHLVEAAVQFANDLAVQLELLLGEHLVGVADRADEDRLELVDRRVLCQLAPGGAEPDRRQLARFDGRRTDSLLCQLEPVEGMRPEHHRVGGLADDREPRRPEQFDRDAPLEGRQVEFGALHKPRQVGNDEDRFLIGAPQESENVPVERPKEFERPPAERLVGAAEADEPLRPPQE